MATKLTADIGKMQARMTKFFAAIRDAQGKPKALTKEHLEEMGMMPAKKDKKVKP